MLIYGSTIAKGVCSTEGKHGWLFSTRYEASFFVINFLWQISPLISDWLYAFAKRSGCIANGYIIIRRVCLTACYNLAYGTLILRFCYLCLYLVIWDNTVVKQVPFIILLQHVLLLQWHACLAILNSWKKSEIAAFLSRDKISGGKNLKSLPSHSVLLKCVCAFLVSHSLGKIKYFFLLEPSPFIFCYIFGILCFEDVCCQVFFPSILWLVAVTRCNQLSNGTT